MNPTTTPHTTPKDFFVQLGVTMALYVSVISLINLCFDIINYYYADTLTYYSIGTYSIRWSISLLIVLLPLNYLLEIIIHRDTVKDPSKNDLLIRKWRVYLTLFLASATIIVDLIVLINTYLGGEITTRFVMKAIVVLVISIIVFVLFLLERGALEQTFWTRRGLRILIGLLALAAIVTGFMTVGSPYTQRELNFDSQRVQNLAQFQSEIIQYWQRTGALPATLKDAAGLYMTVPTDPDTHAQYEYSITGPKDYTLCATFGLPSSAQKQSAMANYYYLADSSPEAWAHATGRTCFDRTIDTSRYPSMVPQTTVSTPNSFRK